MNGFDGLASFIQSPQSPLRRIQAALAPTLWQGNGLDNASIEMRGGNRACPMTKKPNEQSNRRKQFPADHHTDLKRCLSAGNKTL
jgi:hypothetical protein